MSKDNLHSDRTFLHRTDALAAVLNVNVEDLAERLSVSRRTLFAGRADDLNVSRKTWWFLQLAEKQQGILPPPGETPIRMLDAHPPVVWKGSGPDGSITPDDLINRPPSSAIIREDPPGMTQEQSMGISPAAVRRWVAALRALAEDMEAELDK